MGQIRWRGVDYWQEVDGTCRRLDELIAEIGEIRDDYPIHTPHNEHAEGLPDWLNTTDPAYTCPRCATAYRRSEMRAGACPYCHLSPSTNSARRGAQPQPPAQGSHT